MYKHLRIIFTILSAICIAAVIPVGALLGWSAAIYCALGALLFFLVMMICKQKQISSEDSEQENTEISENTTAEITENDSEKDKN